MMRTVVESPEIAASVAERGRDEVRRHHGIETRARFVRSRFEAIGQKSESHRGNGRRKGALSAVQLVVAGAGVAAAKVSGHGGEESTRPQASALYRRVIEPRSGSRR